MEEEKEEAEDGKGRMEVDLAGRDIKEVVNKWALIKKPSKGQSLQVVSSVDLEARMRQLNDTLLSEARDIGYQYLHQEEWRRGTGMLTTAAMKIKDMVKNKRFESSRWRHWNSDYCLLEDLSRKEIEEDAQKQTPNSTTKKISQPSRFKKGKVTPSRLPGASFGQPKDPDKYEYFDLHALGNRNDVGQLFTKSLGFPLPKSINQASLLNASANPDPEAFGAPTRNLKGGVINSGPARGPVQRVLTAGCEMPPVDRPKASPKLVGFLGGPRNANGHGKKANLGGGSPTMHEYLEHSSGGLAFAREARGGGDVNPPRDAPGVGAYTLPRIFETKSDPKPRDLSAVLTKLQGSRDYRDIASEEMAKLVGFGKGCNRQEHILYGMCLDGLCGRRSQVEMSMLQTSNWRRLGVDSDAQCQEALLSVPVRALPGASSLQSSFSKSAIATSAAAAAAAAAAASSPTKTVAAAAAPTVAAAAALTVAAAAAATTTSTAATFTDISGARSLRADIGRAEREERLARRRAKALSEERRLWTRTLVPDPAETMTPLHMAAYRGDAEAIAKMHRLDINARHGEELKTPLHVAVCRGQLEAVRAILSVFRGTVAVDARNEAGDTALHTAARAGRKEIVEMLCDADADCRLRNADNKLALDSTDKHPVKQVLRIHADYWHLRDELKEVQQERERITKLDGSSLQDYRVTTSGQDGSRPTTNDNETSRGSQRSRIMEIGEDYDSARESIKTNPSLFRVSSAPRRLDDPSKNSFVLGYFPPESKVKSNKSSL